MDGPLLHVLESALQGLLGAVPAFRMDVHGHPVLVVRVLEDVVFNEILRFTLVLVEAQCKLVKLKVNNISF